MRRGFAAALTAALLVGPLGGAAAKEKPQPSQQRPEAFEALVRCRAIADDKARLQCFDSAAQNLQQAAERKELVVIDRKQIRETKRSLFGLDLPRLSIFGGGDGDNDEEAVTSIESTVAGAVQDGNGRWIVKLADGSTWAQTDNEPLALRPRAGQKIKVRRAALGSYTMNVNGQPAIRVKRQL
ncbi:MAG: hypothetical protein JOZ90_14405 [Alphaproteobacteria bacterium]|nr:hypothetical protein [Alphaproteobacteria bacterium]MBV9372507.1 hypothetical protein [Alphaproteobacteria bacterium]MBV9902264.1 hypothetical protein [Alphaproteobacteria bacterium]